jgi:hypothetical protein
MVPVRTERTGSGIIDFGAGEVVITAARDRHAKAVSSCE